nr:hypothetical protein [Bacillus safensis]
MPVKFIADRLGNNPQMINDIYSHTFEELEIESVEVFAEAMNYNLGDVWGDSKTQNFQPSLIPLYQRFSFYNNSICNLLIKTYNLY